MANGNLNFVKLNTNLPEFIFCFCFKNRRILVIPFHWFNPIQSNPINKLQKYIAYQSICVAQYILIPYVQG